MIWTEEINQKELSLLEFLRILLYFLLKQKTKTRRRKFLGNYDANFPCSVMENRMIKVFIYIIAHKNIMYICFLSKSRLVLIIYIFVFLRIKFLMWLLHVNNGKYYYRNNKIKCLQLNGVGRAICDKHPLQGTGSDRERGGGTSDNLNKQTTQYLQVVILFSKNLLIDMDDNDNHWTTVGVNIFDVVEIVFSLFKFFLGRFLTCQQKIESTTTTTIVNSFTT